MEANKAFIAELKSGIQTHLQVDIEGCDYVRIDILQAL